MQATLMHTSAPNAQVVVVKQYNGLLVNPGTSLVPYSWDGAKGGILAVMNVGATSVPPGIGVFNPSPAVLI